MSAVVYIVLAALAGLGAGIWRSAAVPYGVIVCALAALIVSTTISLPLGDQGPRLFDVAIVPAIAGAVLGAFALRLLLSVLVRRWRAAA